MKRLNGKSNNRSKKNGSSKNIPYHKEGVTRKATNTIFQLINPQNVASLVADYLNPKKSTISSKLTSPRIKPNSKTAKLFRDRSKIYP